MSRSYDGKQKHLLSLIFLLELRNRREGLKKKKKKKKEFSIFRYWLDFIRLSIKSKDVDLDNCQWSSENLDCKHWEQSCKLYKFRIVRSVRLELMYCWFYNGYSVTTTQVEWNFSDISYNWMLEQCLSPVMTRERQECLPDRPTLQISTSARRCDHITTGHFITWQYRGL